MPDLGNLLDFDFPTGDYDWMDALANIGAGAGDLGNLVYDTFTGKFVDASTIDPSELMDYDAEGMARTQGIPLPESSVSRSTSDFLRSREADTQTPGSEHFDWSKMADPSASIASAGGNDWARAIAKGLGSALGGLGGGLKSLGGSGSPASTPLPGMGAMLSADTPGGSMPSVPGLSGVQGLMGGGDGGGGLSSLGRLGIPDGVASALMRGQADPIRYAQQAPIDAGPAPRPFTPLTLPAAAPPSMPMPAPPPRVSGLQRLLSERLG